jgi:hypothetical protein
MRGALAMLLIGAALSAGMASARAAERPPAGDEALRRLEEAEQSLRDAMAKALDSVDLLLQALPRYDAPIVNENGDIIIRRRRPEPRSPALRTSAPDGMI